MVHHPYGYDHAVSGAPRKDLKKMRSGDRVYSPGFLIIPLMGSHNRLQKTYDIGTVEDFRT